MQAQANEVTWENLNPKIIFCTKIKVNFKFLDLEWNIPKVIFKKKHAKGIQIMVKDN